MAITGTSSSHVEAAFNSSNKGVSDAGDLFKGLSGDDLTRAKAQYALQKQQETVAFVSNVMKKLNEIAMSVINNLR
ncbi:MAG TPA: hypothetical protein VLE27_17745 [Thermoanaerobaculia bacterium]|nr:hypothetical protein [Thermoanaerobaculia bacterium]